MRYLISALLVLAMIVPANAVRLAIKECTADYVVVAQGAGTDCELTPQYCATIQFSQLRQGSDTLKAADLEARLNGFMTVRQLLSAIPFLDDPDRIVNPGETRGRRQYWCHADRSPLSYGELSDENTYLCSQSDVISISRLPDAEGCPITVSIARDCQFEPDFPSCAP